MTVSCFGSSFERKGTITPTDFNSLFDSYCFLIATDAHGIQFGFPSETWSGWETVLEVAGLRGSFSVQQAREALLSAKTVAEEYLEGPPLESRDCVGIAQVIAQTSENVGADCIGFSFTPYEGEAEVLLEIPKVRLLDRRTFRRDRRSEVQYFVNFEGFPESEGIWASEQLLRRELHDADALIAALKAKLERERNAAASPEEWKMGGSRHGPPRPVQRGPCQTAQAVSDGALTARRPSRQTQTRRAVPSP
uniref:Uncharacterized protein n=1 Tax=Tetraselmis sp. GSL018 TaxID=582737 RepID=A0A061QPW7_9CHLO